MTCRADGSSIPAGAAADDVGALARCCAQATLAHLEGSIAELGQAGALLGDAMAVLRAQFAAALAANADAVDHGECRHHLEAAMVALQCEDALVQMLQSLQQRTLQTADVLRYVVTPRSTELGPVRADRGDRTACEEMASRLRLAVIALDAGIARSGPVRQKKAVVGTVDLF